MSDTIKFGVIGYGHIGKRHADMIKENPAMELVAVCDVDPELQSRVAKSYQDVAFYQDHQQMMEKHPELDVVCVCSPNGLHAQHALDALGQNNHVVCEKPMGLSKANCEAVIHKALQVSKHVFCVMQNRYSPPAVWLKQLMDEDRFGKIYLIQINCYWNRGDSYYKKSAWKGTLRLDGGPLYTQFSHFVDIMYWLMGDIQNVKATFNNFNHEHNTEFEDSGMVHFEFTKGGLGQFNYTTSVYDQNLESSLTIIGEKGSVKVGGQYMDKVEYCDIKDYQMEELPPSNPPNDYGDYKGSAANHQFIFENVLDTLSGKSSVTTNALEGLKVVEIIERIYSYRTNMVSAEVIK